MRTNETECDVLSWRQAHSECLANMSHPVIPDASGRSGIPYLAHLGDSGVENANSGSLLLSSS